MPNLNTIGGIHNSIMNACYNNRFPLYTSYGEKGIQVYKEWHNRESFRDWAIHNGYSKGLRLKRLDSSKDYEPSNCYFSSSNTKSTAIGNKSRVIRNHRNDMREFASLKIGYSKDRLYSIYKSMHTRCDNINHSHYSDYGGRGISVCKEWSGKDGFFYFSEWAMHNGYNKSLTIDRIDVNKNYEPDNCRWITSFEQHQNTRRTIHVDVYGEDMCLAQVAREFNIPYSSLYDGKTS